MHTLNKVIVPLLIIFNDGIHYETLTVTEATHE